MNASYRLKLLIFAVLFILLNILISNYLVEHWANLIWADAQGYYQWLTAVFIKHDALNQPFAYYLPNGNLFNRYTYGVAFMIMPFFLLVHSFNLLFHLPSDGYSPSYGFTMVLAASTYCFTGLYLMYRFLIRHFGRKVVIITLVLLYLGTNAFFYTVDYGGYSHIYSFFLFALIIDRTPAFLEKPSLKNTLLVSIPLSIGVLIRPTNLVMIFFIALYNVHSFNDLRNRALLFISKPSVSLSFLLTGLIFWIPQILYWHATTGDWIVYSYKYSYSGLETFTYWKHPQVLKVLAGPRSGWLVYSPVMLISLGGLVWMITRNRLHCWGILLTFLSILYLDASWWVYTFPCGFGYRSLIEYYPMLAIPMAAVISKLFTVSRRWIIPVVMYLCLIAIFANIRMSFIYQKHTCWDGRLWGWKEYGMIWRNVFFDASPFDYYPEYKE